MLLEESLQVANKSTLRLAHTKEPVFTEHKDTANRVTSYSWHAVQTRLYPQLATSFEYGANQLRGPWDTNEQARDAATKLYEEGAENNFTDKIPHVVDSTIKQSEAGPYQEVHFLDPDTKDVIATAHKEPGATPQHNRSVLARKHNEDYITAENWPDAHKKISALADHPYNEYQVAKMLSGLKGKAPYGVKLHANKAHAVYKTGKSPEDASALHEKTLLAQHDGARIKRHTPTVFELQHNGKVIHSFCVPDQIHEVNGGPLNMAEGSLESP